MSKGIFVTATGTDVGKTYISSLIISKLRKAGINCGYYKAVLSGAENIKGKLIPGDASYVYEKANIPGDLNRSVSYIFEEAVSPHLAARLNGKEVSLNKIKADFDKIKSKYDYVVVEGSGGIICPLFKGKSTIMLTDVIKELNLSTIVVSDSGLGSINSTLLTMEYIKSQDIKVNALFLNRYNHDEIIHRENRNYFEDILDMPIYICEDNYGNLDIDSERLIELCTEI